MAHLAAQIRLHLAAHGFRPGNVEVPVKDQPDSPFVKFQSAGLRIAAGRRFP